MNKASELHHRLSDTTINNKLFPLFVNSPFNLVGLCHDCHEKHRHKEKIDEDLAVVYQSYLDNFAKEWYSLGREDIQNGKESRYKEE